MTQMKYYWVLFNKSTDISINTALSVGLACIIHQQYQVPIYTWEERDKYGQNALSTDISTE